MFWRNKKPGSREGDGAGKPPSAPRPDAKAPATAGSDAPARLLTGDDETDRRRVDFLLQVIARMSESSDFDALLVQIVDESIALCGAERGLLIVVDGRGEPKVRVARNRERKPIEDNLRFSTSVVAKVLESNEPKLATVQSDSDALELGRSVYDLKLRAVMCVPLSRSKEASGRNGSNALRGVLYVDSKAATREFDQGDLGLFWALSQQAAVTLDKARAHQESLEKTRLEQSLELASAVQSGLMPRIPENEPGLQIDGYYQPAERTSGDFFDFVKLRDGRLVVVVGDVSGHGIGPALITASAQATLRAGLRMMPDPAAALTMLNQDLSERIDPGTFLTLLMLTFGRDGSLEISNAGHHGAVLVRKGEVITSDKHALALGFSADVEYGIDDRVQLEAGDVLLAFTDGLIEAHSQSDREQLFGEERVHAILLDHAARGSDAKTITRALAQSALEFAGGKPEDDVTLVVVRKTG
jgi:phosphoserine phosphatase RsbU/P